MQKQNYKAPGAQTLSVHAARRRMTVKQLLVVEGISSLDQLTTWAAQKNVTVPVDSETLFVVPVVTPALISELVVTALALPTQEISSDSLETKPRKKNAPTPVRVEETE